MKGKVNRTRGGWIERNGENEEKALTYCLHYLSVPQIPERGYSASTSGVSGYEGADVVVYRPKTKV